MTYLKNTYSLKDAKRIFGIKTITESSAFKDGREYFFVSFDGMNTGKHYDCLVSDRVLADYKAGKYKDLCISEIWDDDTCKFAELYSIHQKPSNWKIRDVNTNINYPLVSEYIDAILNAEDNFDTLRDLSPVLGEDGRPFMSSGNFAVVFKMTDGKQNYAIKCFTKEQEGREKNYRLITQELEYVSSKYLLNVEYLEDELFVDTQQSDKDTFPVLKMQWAEGVTLDRYIKDHLSDDYALQMLAYEFSRMGMWLMNQDFAHGDLKPDNILVRNDGSLVLVDYDGMFVPAMQGQQATELGTPDFRHPLRTAEQFDARIDDFSIAAIALSLKAIATKPSLWADYHSQDRLLLGSSDYVTPGASPLLRELLALSNDATLSRLFGLFMIALSSQKLSLTSFRLLEISKPERKKLEVLPTKVSDEDIANGVEDEFGVVYSKDGKRLLECKNIAITQYDIKDGTLSICDRSFEYSSHLKSIDIPNSVTSIGFGTFYLCNSLKSINIPIGTRSKFERLLPDYKHLLVETFYANEKK